MSKQRTNKSKYTSPSTGEYCTAAQYLAELMITRQANKKKVNLPFKFWNHDEWKRDYLTQLYRANALMKIYRSDAIVNVLTEKKNAWIYSLFYPKLEQMFEKEERRLDIINERAAKSENVQPITDSKPAPKHGKKSKLSRLKELDD